MDVATQAGETTFAQYDNLTGIRRIEVGCWAGEVRAVAYDNPGLLMLAPMRSTLDFWNIVEYKSGTLMVAPHLYAAANAEFHFRIVPSGPMWLYLPTHYINIPVVNLNNAS